jgi:hypothetical protein
MGDLLKFISPHSFTAGDDGFVMWFPVPNRGGFTAHNLREIADELDRRNAAWSAVVDDYFKSNPPPTT